MKADKAISQEQIKRAAALVHGGGVEKSESKGGQA